MVDGPFEKRYVDSPQVDLLADYGVIGHTVAKDCSEAFDRVGAEHGKSTPELGQSREWARAVCSVYELDVRRPALAAKLLEIGEGRCAGGM